MNIAEPIRETADLEKFKAYYKEIRPNPRNELLLIMGLNTALRISDILQLRWLDVYDFQKEKYKSHISVVEQKTGKRARIFMNESIIDALKSYQGTVPPVTPEEFLFRHKDENISISRIQAFRIIKRVANYYNLPGVISCHSLRKTFGYHAWKMGTAPALLVNIYNHSSYKVTKRYLCIEQEDRDQIFREIQL